MLGRGEAGMGGHTAQDSVAEIVPGGGRQPSLVDTLLQEAVQRRWHQVTLQPSQVTLK